MPLLHSDTTATRVGTPAGGPQQPTPIAPRRARASRLLLPVILTAQLMVVLDMSIVNVALPDMQQALGFSATSLSWVLNAYTLAFGGLLLLGARVGDLLGRRRAFLAGMALFTLASLAGGLATTAWWLLAARAIQGGGAALAAPAVLAFLSSTFAEGRARTRALGLYTAVSIGGAAIGLIAGGMLTQWASWRWVMFVNVPIGLAVMAGTLLSVVETPRQRGRFDLPGAVTATLGTSALVYAFVHAASGGWTDPTTVGAFAAGVLLVGAFVLVEHRAADPITPLSLFTNRTRAGAYISRLLLVAGMTGVFFFLTQYLQEILGYSPLRTGLAFLPVTIALFAASQASARVLVERYGERRVLLAGVTSSLLSMAWMSQLHVGSGYLSVLGPLVLLGLGNGTAFVPLTSAALHAVEPKLAGAASGLVNVSQQVGASVGLAVLVTVFGSFSNDGSAPALGARSAAAARDSFVTGADAAFAAAALLLAGSLVAVGLLVRRPPRPRPAQVTEPELDWEADAA